MQPVGEAGRRGRLAVRAVLVMQGLEQGVAQYRQVGGLEVPRGGEQGQATAAGVAHQRHQPFRVVAQLPAIARGEDEGADLALVVLAPQGGAGRGVPVPLGECQALPRLAPRPEPVDEYTGAVVRLGRLVDSLQHDLVTHGDSSFRPSSASRAWGCQWPGRAAALPSASRAPAVSPRSRRARPRLSQATASAGWAETACSKASMAPSVSPPAWRALPRANWTMPFSGKRSARASQAGRSEERRVGEGCRWGGGGARGV